MKKLTAALMGLVLVAALAACGMAPKPDPDPDPEPQSIAAIAAEAGTFETLLSILPADLAAALSDDEAGPFTVFAPTDDAFDAIAAVLPTLSEAEVREVLELHVIDGAVSSTDAMAAVSARSLGSELLFFIVDGDDLLVDGYALVEAADIEASNGVIHVIDAVLLPKGTIADVAVEFAGADEPEFTTLVAAIQAADAAVFDTLADVGEGPFTVFAPTDGAFAALPAGALQGLLDDQAALTNVLLYHATDAGALVASQVVALVSEGAVDVTMLNGDDVTVALDNGAVRVNDATVVITDVLTANGVIHVIDAVLLPPTE
jgi:transforming growth factor-beta-induced protein